MLQKSTLEKTLQVFFINPTKKFSLKELSEKIGIAHTSIKRELSTLSREKLISIDLEVKGKRKFPLYFANLSEKFLYLKKLYNELELKNSNLVEFLSKKFAPNSIILFGSYSRGEDSEESDIDLFVESKFEGVDLRKYEKILQRKINLLFKEDINLFKKEILNNLLNGTILYGTIRLK